PPCNAHDRSVTDLCGDFLDQGDSNSVDMSIIEDWHRGSAHNKNSSSSMNPSKVQRVNSQQLSRRANGAIPLDLLDVVELLDVLNIQFVFSPSEADGQCAWLCSQGLADAVLTEDCDLLVHGAPTVVRGFFSTETAVEYHQRDLLRAG